MVCAPAAVLWRHGGRQVSSTIQMYSANRGRGTISVAIESNHHEVMHRQWLLWILPQGDSGIKRPLFLPQPADTTHVSYFMHSSHHSCGSGVREVNLQTMVPSFPWYDRCYISPNISPVNILYGIRSSGYQQLHNQRYTLPFQIVLWQQCDWFSDRKNDSVFKQEKNLQGL